MNVLVVNAGSSSMKFTLYHMQDESVLASGQVERIGQPSRMSFNRPDSITRSTPVAGGGPRLIYKRPGHDTISEEIDITDHTEALKEITSKLIDPAVGVIASLAEVQAIGHRIVHGGEKISKPLVLDTEAMDTVRDCIPLAPLHNPPNISGVEACKVLFPNAENVGVFDTAFHQTMPAENFLYAIPYHLYKENGIRRYGFHGTSHHFVTLAASEFVNKKPEDLKIITCHLGNGCSMAAISGGKVVDTSMGLTPLEGLMMGTRSGDIDAGAVFYMINDMGLSVKEVDNILNKQSGLQGIVGVSDMRDTLQKAEEGDSMAELALNMFVRRVTQYVGSYFVTLGGADLIVFTGGIGEWSTPIRAKILSKLACLGVDFDATLNKETAGKPGIISTPASKVTAMVMPTNEELMIARQTVDVLKK